MVFQSYALYPNMTVARTSPSAWRCAASPKPERDKAIARGRRDAADRPSARPQAQPALGRPAPARRHGPRPGAQSRRSSCSTSRSPISTPSCASTCAPRSSGCTRRMGTTIVYVTHDQIEAMTLATKIAVLKDGVLQQFGTPAEIYNEPGQYVRRRFHGLAGDEPRCRPSGRQEGSALAVALDPRRRARSPARPLRTAPCASPPRAATVIFGIRPEAITDPDGADRNSRPSSSRPNATSRWSSRRARTPCRDPARRRARWSRGCAPTRAYCRASACPSPSTWTRRCSSIPRARRASPEPWRSRRRISSSSAPASAGRRSRRASPAAAPRSSILERGERLTDSAGTAATPAPFSSDGVFPAEGDLARRRRRALQPRQLLLCRRQFEILRRRADPLPPRGFRGDGA